jgi:hypothetical protein
MGAPLPDLEVEDPRYILDLLARIATVSLETMTIVDALPRVYTLNRTPHLSQRDFGWAIVCIVCNVQASFAAGWMA